MIPFRVSLQSKIRTAFELDKWQHAGTNKHGVCLYNILKDNKIIAHGSMLQLYNEAIMK